MADLSEPEAGEGEACCAPCHRSLPAALPCSATLRFSQVFWLAASPDYVGFCFLLFASKLKLASPDACFWVYQCLHFTCLSCISADYLLEKLRTYSEFLDVAMNIARNKGLVSAQATLNPISSTTLKKKKKSTLIHKFPILCLQYFNTWRVNIEAQFPSILGLCLWLKSWTIINFMSSLNLGVLRQKV